MKRLRIYKRDAVHDMIVGIEEYAEQNGIDLSNKIPDDVNDFDDVFNDGGEGRCEHFTDLSWDYAFQFGVLEDYGDGDGFEAHVWSCIESALSKLQRKHNKNE